MELANKNTLKEYEQFIQGHPKGHFMQSPAWGRVKENWKWEGIIVRDDDGNIKGTMSVLIRKVPFFPVTLMYSPRGPVCDLSDRETFEKLISGAKQLAKKHKSYVIKLDPDVEIENKDFSEMVKSMGFRIRGGKNFEGIQPRFVFRIHLDGRNEDEIMKSFQSKTRYNVRLSGRRGVEVKVEGKESLSPFWDIMLETGLRDGFVIRAKEYFVKLLDELGENARLYMAYYEGKPIAGTIAVLYGDKVWYLYGASSNQYRNVMPNYLLQWEMIKWSIESGCKIYDFRGVSGDLDENNPLYGLYRFKKGFNGEFTEFVGEMDLVINPLMEFTVRKGEKTFRTMRKHVFMLKNKNKTRQEEKA